MTGTCKTCRWWNQGHCEFVDTIAASAASTRFEVEVEVADDSGLHVKLITGPDFGCVHHEGTDTKPMRPRACGQFDIYEPGDGLGLK